METCTNCAGEGIVGAGDFPTQKQGPLSTCTVCSGTGKIEGAIEAPVEPTPETPSEETPASEESFLVPSGEAGETSSDEAPSETPVE